MSLEEEVEGEVVSIPLQMARVIEAKMGMACISALADRLPMGASDDEVRAFMHQEIESHHGADIALVMALAFSFICALPPPSPPRR